MLALTDDGWKDDIMRYIEEEDFGRQVEKSSIVIDKDLNIISSDSNFFQLINALIPKNLSDVLDGDIFAEKIRAATTVNKTCFIFPVLARGQIRNLLIEVSLIESEPKKIYEIVFLDPIIIASQFYDSAEKNFIYESILKNFDMKYFYYDVKTERVILKDFDGLEYDFSLDDFVKYLSNEKMIPKNSETIIDFKSYILIGKDDHRFSFVVGKKETVILCNPSFNPKNEKTLLIGTILNKEEREFVSKQFDSIDHLTNTLNKQSATAYAKNKIDICKRPTSFIILDIDDFKDINDTYGHMFGDHSLQMVANVIKKVTYGKGNVGRFGGDEFVIILDDIVEYSAVKAIACEIRAGVQWCLSADKTGLAIGCSMGIARFPIDANNYDDIFKIADKCLYIAKMKGKNRYIIYDEEKHGKFNLSNEKIALSSERKKVSIDRKYEIVKRCFIQDEGWIDEVINRAANMIGFSSTISIFIGDKMECLHHCGNYGVTKASYILEKGYLSKFENNERVIDNIITLENQEKELYRYLSKSYIKSCYQYLLYDSNGNIMGVFVSYVYGDAHTYKSNEMDILAIVAKSIEEYYRKKLGI